MTERTLAASESLNSPPSQRSNINHETSANLSQASTPASSNGGTVSNHNYSTDNGIWTPTSAWAQSWKGKLPLQTIMRLLQVLVPQVEKICM
ncbi:unnamed protein product, partial [Rotaria magnacalcarata]